MGAKDSQAHSAIMEAVNYDGPSIILAYSPCIEHGYNLIDSIEHSKLAVDTGYWNLYRYNPNNVKKNKPKMKVDSKITKPLEDLLQSERRFNNIYNVSDNKHLDKLKNYVIESYNKLKIFD